MDEIGYSMDKFSHNLESLPRLFTGTPPLKNVVYQPHKTGWLDCAFSMIHFSIILSGAGEYASQGRRWTVTPPCVFIEWPDILVKYGPRGEWEELSLGYGPALASPLLQAGLVSLQQPFWPIGNAVRFQQLLPVFFQSLTERHTVGGADRIDALANLLLKESLIGHRAALPDKHESAIRAIQAVMGVRFLESIDVEELALKHGLSPTNFRKQWKRFCALPPGQYLMHLRVQEACLLLRETVLSIKEIAVRLAFEDPLYFSRKFRQITGYTATEYRARYAKHPAPQGS